MLTGPGCKPQVSDQPVSVEARTERSFTPQVSANASWRLSGQASPLQMQHRSALTWRGRSRWHRSSSAYMNVRLSIQLQP